MSELDWSRLTKQQNQYLEQQKRRQQQRKQRIKFLYKNQLQKMIQDHKNHVEDQKDHDKRLIRQAEQRQKRKMIYDRDLAEYKFKVKEEIAHNNLRSTYDKKEKNNYQIQLERKFYADRFKKVKTQAEHQSESRIRHRQIEKSQLAKAYESQIKNQQARKKLQKLEDEKFSQLREQIQKKKQENRRYYLNRIRNGYRQNPEVYQYSANLLLEKQQQKSTFLKRLAENDAITREELQKQRNQNKKMREEKQISNFNKQYFETKALRERYQSLQQISQFNRKQQTMEHELQSEKQKELREQEQKKHILKLELEKQMNEAHYRSAHKNQMNQKEYLLNRSKNIPTLPGLSKDFNSQKQYKIIQSFLIGDSRKKLEFSG